MNCQKGYIVALSFCFLFIFAACREIITPEANQEEPASTLNRPIESATPNSYNFEIMAKNNSSNFAKHIPVLQILNLSLSVNNYNSGTVHIQLINMDQTTVYNKIFSYGISNSTVNLDSLAPSIISLKFDNFTGDFAVNLNGKP